jgi:hypothetical protein
VIEKEGAKKYAIGGIEFSRDDVAKISNTLNTEGWELINMIMNKVQIDALESTLGAASPLDHSEYTHAHGQYAAVLKFADFQKDIQDALERIFTEEPKETPKQN